MIIEVKKNHIKEGKRRKPSCCPVALALKDITGEEWVVYRHYAYSKGSLSLSVELPLKITKWIDSFDNSNRLTKLFIRPISFEV